MKMAAASACLSAGLCLALPTVCMASCAGEAGTQMQGAPGAPFDVSIESPQKIPLSAPFEAEVTICALETGLPSRVTLDATMPAHKHGMNYEPSISAVAEGRYEVKGLLFHMPGIWRFEVTAYQSGKPFRFSHEVKVQ